MKRISSAYIRWFLGLLTPLLLAGLIAVGFSYVIFSGPIHGNLAGKADFFLLDRLLMLSSKYEAPSSVPVSLVPITESDLATMGSNRENGVGDINIDEYASLITKVWRQNPRLIVLHWFPMAHKNTSAEYAPLTKVLKEINRPESIVIAFPVTGQFKLPAEIRQHATVVDDEICTDVMQTCPYVDTWNDWVVQIVLNRINTFIGNPPLFTISKSFSTKFPNFVLNLPRPDSIPHVRPVDIKDDDVALSGKFVFIGRDIPRNFQNEAWRELAIVGAKTIYNHTDPKKYGFQTPLHVFWSQIAAMRLTNKMVRVPPSSALNVFALTLSCVLIFLTLGIGANVGLSFYLIFSVAFFVFDMVALRAFNFYIPPFLILYLGFLTCVTAGFIQISYEIFYRSRLSERKRAVDFAADLKSNFISLVSHNLNTPIAKMQGMIELLRGYARGQEPEADLGICARLTSQLSLAVSIILTTVRLRDAGLEKESISLRKLVQEFGEQGTGRTLQNMGVRFRAAAVSDTASEIDLPIRCDKKCLQLFLGAMVLLHRSDEGNEVDLELSLVEGEDHSYRLLCAVQRSGMLPSVEHEFFTRIWRNFVKFVVEAHNGTDDDIQVYSEDGAMICSLNL